MQLLEKDPARRPASAHDVAAAFDRIPLTALGTRARRSLHRRATRGPADPTTAAHPVAPGGSAALRPRAAVLVAAAVLLLAGGAVLLAPLVVRLASPNGELVIEVDDPTIEVVVKQDGAVLHDRTKQREFHLRAGKGEVEFYDPDTGVKLTTKTFRVYRGGKEVVKAGVHELAAAKPPVRPAPPAPAAGSLDGLRRQDIAAEELALAGGGDAAKAPAELVAVVGTGRLRHWAAVSSLTFSPDGKYLMSSGGDFTVRLWDVATGRPVDAVPSRDWRLYGLEPRPAGPPRLATVEFGRALHIPPGVQGLRTIYSPFALSPDGKYVAGKHGPLNRVLLWDAAGKQTEVVRPDKYTMGNMAFSPDATLLAMTWYDEGANKEGVLEVWEVSARKVRHTVPLGKGVRGFTVAFTPDGREVVVGCSDGTVRFRDVASGQERRTLKADLDVPQPVVQRRRQAAGGRIGWPARLPLGSGVGEASSHRLPLPRGVRLGGRSQRGRDHPGGGERRRGDPAVPHRDRAGAVAAGRRPRTVRRPGGRPRRTDAGGGGGRRPADPVRPGWRSADRHTPADGTPYLSLGRGQLLPLALSPDGRTVAAAAAGWIAPCSCGTCPRQTPRRRGAAHRRCPRLHLQPGRQAPGHRPRERQTLRVG
ncbi:MAG: hypothetical protein U0736_09855 [Gemmataceae bacterium]